jgi:4-hydroxy-3-methylbut-2-en-1-yl diphosphate reductase
VDDLVHTMTGLGPLTLRETQVVDEDIRFTLPREVS